MTKYSFCTNDAKSVINLYNYRYDTFGWICVYLMFVSNVVVFLHQMVPFIHTNVIYCTNKCLKDYIKLNELGDFIVEKISNGSAEGSMEGKNERI